MKNDIIVLEAKIDKKNQEQTPEMTIEEREEIIMELEERIEKLERENFMLKNNKTDTSFGRKSQTESDKIIKDLSQQNAKLRLKVADLTEKVKELGG